MKVTTVEGVVRLCLTIGVVQASVEHLFPRPQESLDLELTRLPSSRSLVETHSLSKRSPGYAPPRRTHYTTYTTKTYTYQKPHYNNNCCHYSNQHYTKPHYNNHYSKPHYNNYGHKQHYRGGGRSFNRRRNRQLRRLVKKGVLLGAAAVGTALLAKGLAQAFHG